MVAYPSESTLRMISWGVWGVFAFLVALVAGVLLYGTLVVGPLFGVPTPRPYLAFLGASLLGTVAFVLVSALDV